ncbi:MAG: DUF4105 domain-containing protein [Planctomycetaceae bacterium]|nr:DUF4105 domain-containing protein [Planctomycetaceae bacterium]
MRPVLVHHCVFVLRLRLVMWVWLVVCCASATGCKTLAPSNDRHWAADMARLPYAEITGSQATIRNVRNCNYRTADKFDVQYVDRTYDLDKLDSVDFIVMPFAEHPELAHTMLAFGFEGKEFVDVSVEIRREEGEAFSTSGGFVRQFELMYVVADERDAIRTTTNQLLRDVYIYRTVATPEQSRALFHSVFRRANQLRYEPEFYHTLTNNCTTNILNHVNEIATNKIHYNYQILLPGLADKLAYDRGLLVKHGTFEQTKAYARVNEAAFAHRDDPDFSIEIRRR